MSTEFEKRDPATFGVEDPADTAHNEPAREAGGVLEGDVDSAWVNDPSDIKAPPEEREPNVVALVDEDDVPETE